MKYKVAIVVDDTSLLNNLFFSTDPKIVRDNQQECYVKLKQMLMKYDIDLSTQDINTFKESDIIIQIDNANGRMIKTGSQKVYLMIMEPPVVKKSNWNSKYHSGYERVFTWNDAIADNTKYFLLRMAYKFDTNFKITENLESKKLCTMIIGYKRSQHELELYSERLAVIHWFTKNHPEDFEYFGAGWPNYLPPIVHRKLLRIYLFFERKILEKLFKTIFSKNITYKGKVFSKYSILQNYKFSICYENTKDIPGYITEKIFDCFSAGCVPIYWGASNICELIPSNCFIDRKLFKSNEDLYEFISHMSNEKYIEYLLHIKEFLTSSNADPFKADYFAKTLTNYILEDLGLDSKE